MVIKYTTVTFQQIKENNFSLNPKYYIDEEEEEE